MQKFIPGYQNLYTADEHGNVFSVTTGRQIKWYNDGNGYYYVQLYKNGHRKCKKVHRIVAETFLPNPNNLPEVNHKDENKANNDISNLEWCTSQYNHNYGTRTERATKANTNGACSKAVIAINKKSNEKKIFPSASEAARQLGDVYYRSNIIACLKGRQKSAYGYFWKYADEG